MLNQCLFVPRCYKYIPQNVNFFYSTIRVLFQALAVHNCWLLILILSTPQNWCISQIHRCHLHSIILLTYWVCAWHIQNMLLYKFEQHIEKNVRWTNVSVILLNTFWAFKGHALNFLVFFLFFTWSHLYGYFQSVPCW